MAVTQNTYTGDGSTVLYNFTFPYLATTDIKVKLDGVDTTAYTLANATTVQMNSAPASAAKIIIYRNTDNDNKKATFYPGSAIKAEDLNNNYDQILYTVQEVDNNSMSTLGDTAMQGDMLIGQGFGLQFEGTTPDDFETRLIAEDPTADRVVTMPDATGTMVLTSNPDDTKLKFGTDDDLEIYHEAFNDQSIIKADSKIISIMSGDSVEIEDNNGVNIALFEKEGGCTLYHDSGSQKLKTISDGVYITGSLGIGTTNPGNLLDISGNAHSKVLIETTGTANAAGIQIKHASGNAAEQTWQIQTDGSADGDLKLRNATDDTDVVFVKTNGKVGIGTTSPDALLDVYGDGANGEITAQRSGGASILTQAQESLGKFGTSSNHSLQLMANSTGYVTLKNNGKVGIGDSDPGYKLTVEEGTNDVVASFSSSDESAWIQLRDNDTTDTAVMIGAKDDDLMLRAGSNTQVTIKNDGKVLIGTTTSNASDRFTIVDPGNAFMSLRSDTEADNTSQVFDFAVGTDNRASTNVVSSITSTIAEGSASGGTLKGYLAFSTNAGDNLSEKVRIDPDGNVGIGTTSPDTLLHLRGEDTAVIRLENSDTSLAEQTDIQIIGGLEFEKQDPSGAGVGVVGGLRMYSGIDGITSYLSLSTSDGTGNDAERVKITSDGALIIDAGNAEQQLREFTSATDSDISGLFPSGSNFGTLHEVSPNGNHVLALRENDTTDSFAIISGGGNYNSDSVYDTVVAKFLPTSCELYFDNIKKIETSSHGVAVSGGLTTNGAYDFFTSSNAGGYSNLTLKKSDSEGDDDDFLQCRSSGSSSDVPPGNLAKLIIAGDGDVTNANNSYGSISDSKLKENIVDANSQWNDLKAIKVRNFNFKTDSNTKLLGVVAQEVETISPALVSESIDRDSETNEDLGTKTKSVKYSVLYMKAVKALQEAMTRIETLEAKVAALESA